LTAAMMLAHLGLNAEAQKIENAVLDAVRQQKMTVDVGGPLGTRECAQWIAERGPKELRLLYCPIHAQGHAATRPDRYRRNAGAPAPARFAISRVHSSGDAAQRLCRRKAPAAHPVHGSRADD